MTIEATIRDAKASDAASVAAIYAHHVLTGVATFDTEPPPVDFWREKIDLVLTRGWPFLVAEERRATVGYAYATQFRDRPAYAHTCENSIYVHPDAIGRGAGSLLLGRLLDDAAAAGFREMIAVISGGPASIAFHSRAGFVEAGRMRGVGCKFGRWLDTVYMQHSLGEK